MYNDVADGLGTSVVFLEDKMTGSKGVNMSPKPKRPESKQPEMKTVGVRSTRAWADWLERGAKFCRTDTAKLLDSAAVDYLKARGFDEPAPPRL
jgi:hypothetical protein